MKKYDLEAFKTINNLNGMKYDYNEISIGSHDISARNEAMRSK